MDHHPSNHHVVSVRLQPRNATAVDYRVDYLDSHTHEGPAMGREPVRELSARLETGCLAPAWTGIDVGVTPLAALDLAGPGSAGMPDLLLLCA